MSEMVERVAAAMEARSATDPVDIEDIARAAIEAMRDAPDEHSTPAILVAGKKALYSCSSDPELDDARGCWRAMIDEALK